MCKLTCIAAVTGPACCATTGAQHWVTGRLPGTVTTLAAVHSPSACRARYKLQQLSQSTSMLLRATCGLVYNKNNDRTTSLFSAFAVTKTITEVSRYQSTHKSYTSLSLPLVNFSTCYSSVHQMCSNSDSISEPNIFFILRQSTCSLNFKLKITIAHTVRQSHLYARSSQRGPVLPAGQTQTPVSASQGTSLIH